MYEAVHLYPCGGFDFRWLISLIWTNLRGSGWEATYHRCQAPHGGLKANDAKRFEELEAENAPAEATGPSSDADNFSASGKSPAAD